MSNRDLEDRIRTIIDDSSVEKGADADVRAKEKALSELIELRIRSNRKFLFCSEGSAIEPGFDLNLGPSGCRWAV